MKPHASGMAADFQPPRIQVTYWPTKFSTGIRTTPYVLPFCVHFALWTNHSDGATIMRIATPRLSWVLFFIEYGLRSAGDYQEGRLWLNKQFLRAARWLCERLCKSFNLVMALCVAQPLSFKSVSLVVALYVAQPPSFKFYLR